MSNPVRRAVLESIRSVREGTTTHRHTPFARHTLRIPENDYRVLVHLFPRLNSNNPDERLAAWDAFELSEFAEPYRVGKLFRGVIQNGVIAK